jgi:hypothetical protein
MSAQFKVGDKVRLNKEAVDALGAIGGKDAIAVIESLKDRRGDSALATAGVFGMIDTGWLELAPPAPALIRADRKYRTRSGRAVKRIICTDAEGRFPVVAVVELDAGVHGVVTYTADGKYALGCGDLPQDLIEIPAEPIVGFVNLYRTQGGKIAVSSALSPDGPDPLPAPTQAVWIGSAKVEVLP